MLCHLFYILLPFEIKFLTKLDIKKTSYNIKKHEWQGDGQTATVTQVEESMNKSNYRNPRLGIQFATSIIQVLLKVLLGHLISKERRM